MSEVVVCQNIGPRQRRRRYHVALLGAVVSLAGLVALIVLDAGWAWRAALLLPLWGAFAAFFEARDSTCIALALFDEQNMDGRAGSVRGDRVLDRAVALQLRKKAMLVLLKAFVCALALTALALVI